MVDRYKDRHRITLRFDENETLPKVKQKALENKRSINSEILFLINKGLNQYHE